MTAYLWTGQTACRDFSGKEIPCTGSGQDAEFRRGIPWPASRFETVEETVLDRLTGLVWAKDANMVGFPLQW